MSEDRVEYGERRIICPLYKAAAIQGYMKKGKGIPYVGPFDEIACDGDRCGMYSLCQAKQRGIDVLIKPPAVPGL